METSPHPEPTSEPGATDSPSRTPASVERNRKRSGRTRKILLWLSAVVVLAVAGRYGYDRWQYGQHHVSTDDAQVDGHIIPVLAKVGGYVSSVYVSENERISANTLLVALDDVELREHLALAEADLAAAEIVASGGSPAQVAAAFSQEASLEAQITAAQANADRTSKDLERIKKLADEEIVSPRELDAAEAAAKTADANVNALKKQASAAQATIENAESSVRLAAARLAAARSTVENAKLQQSYARITAPASGIVSKKQVEVGQLVQPGQPLMAVVVDSLIWITANFKETKLADVAIGNEVEIDVDAYPGCTAHGEIESIGAATGAKFALLPPDNATGNFTKVVQRVPVRIAVTRGCGAARPLRPGFSTVVHVSVD